MNERIRELADEAARYSATMFLPTGENGDDLFVEKFAQLIAQEVLDVIENERYTLYEPLVEKVKQHFGVEE